MSAGMNMPAPRRFWSDQDAELRRLYAEHRSLAEIALLLRRPYESVKTRVKRLQLKRPARPPAAMPAAPARLAATRPRDRRKAALRRCLGGCGALFKSAGPGNRICPACAAANDALGGGYDEISLALDGVRRQGD
jgi:hypothetical protein